jgi:hypothetical protein
VLETQLSARDCLSAPRGGGWRQVLWLVIKVFTLKLVIKILTHGRDLASEPAGGTQHVRDGNRAETLTILCLVCRQLLMEMQIRSGQMQYVRL